MGVSLEAGWGCPWRLGGGVLGGWVGVSLEAGWGCPWRLGGGVLGG